MDEVETEEASTGSAVPKVAVEVAPTVPPVPVAEKGNTANSGKDVPSTSASKSGPAGSDESVVQKSEKKTVVQGVGKTSSKTDEPSQDMETSEVAASKRPLEKEQTTGKPRKTDIVKNPWMTATSKRGRYHQAPRIPPDPRRRSESK